MNGHYIKVCPEGYLVSQCRCPNNTLLVVDCPSGHRHSPSLYRGLPDKPRPDARLIALAKKLHSNFCTLSHEDQCAWEYESDHWSDWGYHSVWNAPSHKSWLERARDFEAE